MPRATVSLHAGANAWQTAAALLATGEGAQHLIILTDTPWVAGKIPAPFDQHFTGALPPALPGLQRFHGARHTLTLGFGALPQLLRRVCASVDSMHVDASLAAQCASHLARIAVVDARVCITSTIEPTQQAALNRCGFRFDSLHTARFVAHTHRRGESILTPPREAIVLGAGLAGTAAASRLAARGWAVTLIDRHHAPAQEASGNLAGVMSPMLSRDDNRTSRLSRASFLYLLRELTALDTQPEPPLWSACGVAQHAKDPREAALLAEILSAHAYPNDFCSPLREGQGVYFPQGGWVNPPSLCRARLAAWPSIRSLFGQEVCAIERVENQWSVQTTAGLRASAPVLVLANGYEAAQFARGLHFKKVRGQVAHLPEGALPAIDEVILRDGYLTPAVEGQHCLGATYDFDDERRELVMSSHAANLARLPALLPDAPEPNCAMAGRVGFRSLTIDRLPIVGALPNLDAPTAAVAHSDDIPRIPGLFGLLGLGSRGLTWSALMGESLAASLSGEPLPIESDLWEAIDPARFLVRAARTQSAGRS